MRPILFSFTLIASTISFAGCRSQPTNPDLSGSLADKEARYAAMREQYLSDCVRGTPDHVNNNQPLCDAEKAKMAPLGNELIKEEQEAAQHPNP
jgi:hypothetical protein